MVGLACPSIWQMVERSTPDLRSATAILLSHAVRMESFVSQCRRGFRGASKENVANSESADRLTLMIDKEIGLGGRLDFPLLDKGS